MRQWNDLRSVTGFTDWLIETGQADAIDRVRAEADALWHQAGDFYDRARRTEQDGRPDAVAALRAARRALPDFVADNTAAATVIARTPGLRDETYQAAADPNARRPGSGTLGWYQVQDDPGTRDYPDGVTGFLAGLAGVEPRTLTTSEAAILDELGFFEAGTFNGLKDEAFRTADQQYASPDQNDDQNDAFRHAYWSARMAQEFGDDWAARYATAHESLPGNQAAREAMDLHNNEVGRSIAAAHPDATGEQLAVLIRAAVDEGRMAVIDRDGNLAYSDQVRPEDTGEPRDEQLPGHPQPKKTGS
jgi:hypothetical protein